MFDQSDKVSQTQAARSFKCSQQYICKTLKKYTSIRKRQKIVISIRSKEQKAEARIDVEDRNFKNLSWIIDDAPIFTLSNNSSNVNSKFYKSNIRLAPEDVKYKKKFEDDKLLWLCFSENNVNFVCKNDNPINVPECCLIENLGLFKTASIQE